MGNAGAVMCKTLTAIFIGPFVLAIYFWRHRNDRMECHGSANSTSLKSKGAANGLAKD